MTYHHPECWREHHACAQHMLDYLARGSRFDWNENRRAYGLAQECVAQVPNPDVPPLPTGATR